MAAIFRSAAKKKKCLQVMFSSSLMREEKKHLQVHTTQTLASSSILCSKINRSFGLLPSSSSPTIQELKVNQFLHKGTCILSFFDFYLYSQKTKIADIKIFLLKLLNKIYKLSHFQYFFFWWGIRFTWSLTFPEELSIICKHTSLWDHFWLFSAFYDEWVHIRFWVLACCVKTLFFWFIFSFCLFSWGIILTSAFGFHVASFVIPLLHVMSLFLFKIFTSIWFH